MDLNSLLGRQQPTLTHPQHLMTPRGMRALQQFAREYSQQNALIRAALPECVK
jgi:hypothetical protein